MVINGFRLPTLLEDLIAAGHWKLPENPANLERLTKFQDTKNLSFLNLESIQRETKAGQKLAMSNAAKYYGVTLSDLSATEPGYLNMNMAVVIAINPEEEVICLNYRSSENEPSVVASVYIDKQPGRWQTIAANFAEFAIEVGF